MSNKLLLVLILLAALLLFRSGYKSESFAVIDFEALKLQYPREPNCDPAEGDLHLTNLYRRLHHLDGVQRRNVFQFQNALAGGSYGINREQYTGELYDREMSKIKAHIIRDIAADRVDCPMNQLYDVPSKPLFIPDGPGDERILGIPSQVGTLPSYY